jgi:ATP-dependent DNA helicase RecG
MYLDENGVRQLLASVATGETQRVELKRAPPWQAELAERICGMLNSRFGGVILLGVEPDGKVAGLASVPEATDRVWQAIRLISPAPPLAPDALQEWALPEGPILTLTLPVNGGPLYQAGGVCWIRKGSHTIPMTVAEIAVHLRNAGTLPWETTLCPHATLADLDPTRLAHYRAQRPESSTSHQRHMADEELLIRLDIAGQDAAGIVRPTRAGMLLFGRGPHLHIPQSEVVCMRWRDSLGVGTYLDRRILVGPLPELIAGAAAFLERHMQMGGRIRGFVREDLPEYPLAALREAVVNGLVHRDYSLAGETVRLFIYGDRVEVHSPGSLVPGLTLEDLIALRARSNPRNPRIAGLLRDLPGGFMERVGAGVRMMVYEMRESGKPDPEFSDLGGEFLVTFRNGQAPTIDPSAALNPRQRAGLALLQRQASFTSSDYIQVTQAATRTAQHDLQALVRGGWLIARGTTRTTRYYRGPGYPLAGPAGHSAESGDHEE